MASTEVGPSLWALNDPNYYGQDLVILARAHNIAGFQVGYGVWWRLDSNYNGQRDVLEAHAIGFAHVLTMNGGDVAPIQGPIDFGREWGDVNVVSDPRRIRMQGPTRGGVMNAPLRPSRMYMDQRHWEDIVNFSLESQQVEAAIQAVLKITLPEPRTCWDRLDDDL